MTEVIINNFEFIDSKSGGPSQSIDDTFLDDFNIDDSSSNDVPF